MSPIHLYIASEEDTEKHRMGGLLFHAAADRKTVRYTVSLGEAHHVANRRCEKLRAERTQARPGKKMMVCFSSKLWRRKTPKVSCWFSFKATKRRKVSGLGFPSTQRSLSLAPHSPPRVAVNDCVRARGFAP